MASTASKTKVVGFFSSAYMVHVLMWVFALGVVFLLDLGILLRGWLGALALALSALPVAILFAIFITTFMKGVEALRETLRGMGVMWEELIGFERRVASFMAVVGGVMVAMAVVAEVIMHTVAKTALSSIETLNMAMGFLGILELLVFALLSAPFAYLMFSFGVAVRSRKIVVGAYLTALPILAFAGDALVLSGLRDARRKLGGKTT